MGGNAGKTYRKITKGSAFVINITLISYTAMSEWEKQFYKLQ